VKGLCKAEQLKENSAVIIKDGYTGKRIGSYDERGLRLK